MGRVLRHPALHFVLIGSAIWLAVQLWADHRFRVVTMPGEARVEALVQAWQQGTGRIAGPADRDALIRAEIDQRMLFREALRRGLHLRDPVVLRRLSQDIRFLGLEVAEGERIDTALALGLHEGDELIRRRLVERMLAQASAGLGRPDDAQLRRFHAEHRARWQRPAMSSFEQIFIADGPRAALRALALLTQLNGANAPIDERPAGDPFLHGRGFAQASSARVSAMFGAAFSQALSALPVAPERWQGPLRSAYGLHLVRLLEHQAAGPADYESVRDELERDWRLQQEQAARQRLLHALRGRYRVQPR